MPERKTGLGDSLLLKRTVQPEVQSPDAADAASGADSMPMETPQTPQASVHPKRSKRSKKLMLRDRCTIYLDVEVNQQLDIAARIENKERSEVVTEILRQHLPKYRIDVEVAE
jgi:hypothetical protein